MRSEETWFSTAAMLQVPGALKRGPGTERIGQNKTRLRIQPARMARTWFSTPLAGRLLCLPPIAKHGPGMEAIGQTFLRWSNQAIAIISAWLMTPRGRRLCCMAARVQMKPGFGMERHGHRPTPQLLPLAVIFITWLTTVNGNAS